MSFSLPIELWRMAWRSSLTADLRSLSLTCHLFRDISQPLLFEILSFMGPYPEEIDGLRAPALIRRLKRSKERFTSLGSNPRLATMVRSWSFSSCRTITSLTAAHHPGVMSMAGMDKIIDLSCSIISQFKSTIDAYTSLRRLIISGFDFSLEFSTALSSLSHLRVMHVIDCEVVWPAEIGSVALEGFSFTCHDLKWKEDTAEHYHLVSPSKLVQLEVLEPVSARVFLSVLAAPGPIPHLSHVTLCLSDEVKDAFFAFLDCCPALLNLDIVAPPSFAGVTLPDSSIPALTSYKGPIELIGIFAAGRPIKIAKLEASAAYHLPLGMHVIIDKAVVTEALMHLSKSSATLEEISLPPINTKWSALLLISEMFPQLQRLMLFVQDVGVSGDDLEEDEGEGEGDWALIENVAGAIGNMLQSEPVEDAENGEEEEGDGGETVAGGIVGPFDLFRGLLSMSAQDLEQMGETLLQAMGVDELEDCGDGSSDISDAPETIAWPEDGPPTNNAYGEVSLDSFKDFMFSLGDNAIPLPYNLRYLGLCQMHETLSVKAIPDSEVFSVVEKLGVRYPGLSHVVIGKYPRTWRRRRGVWKHPRPPRSQPGA